MFWTGIFMEENYLVVAEKYKFANRALSIYIALLATLGLSRLWCKEENRRISHRRTFAVEKLLIETLIEVLNLVDLGGEISRWVWIVFPNSFFEIFGLPGTGCKEKCNIFSSLNPPQLENVWLRQWGKEIKCVVMEKIETGYRAKLLWIALFSNFQTLTNLMQGAKPKVYSVNPFLQTKIRWRLWL